MIANADTTIIEEVRSMKEANAAEYDFDIARIIQAARERQEASGRRIIRQKQEGKSTSTANKPLRPSGK